MNCGKEGNLLLNIFMCLGVNATFWLIVNKGEKWDPKVIKGYFLVTLQTLELTGYLTPKPRS